MRRGDGTDADDVRINSADRDNGGGCNSYLPTLFSVRLVLVISLVTYGPTDRPETEAMKPFEQQTRPPERTAILTTERGRAEGGRGRGYMGWVGLGGPRASDCGGA